MKNDDDEDEQLFESTAFPMSVGNQQVSIIG